MTTDTEAALRRQLTELRGKARTRPLIELGQLLVNRHWRIGAGQPAGLPVLSEAITVLDEAYSLLEPTDTLRGSVAVALGELLATRHLAHGGEVRDRETGIHLAREALTFPSMSPEIQARMRLILGQLLVSRAMAALQGDKMTAVLLSGAPPAEARDAEAAAECFRQVLAGGQHNATLTLAAQNSLAMTEAVQDLFNSFRGGPGGALAGFDFGRMMMAMQKVQAVQQEGVPHDASAGGIAVPDALDL